MNTSSSSSSDPSSACDHAGYLCCKFSDGKGSNLARCMDHASRDNAMTGIYIDDQEGKFTWTCPELVVSNTEVAEGSVYTSVSVASALAMAYLA